jgi:hypothetical protein
MKKLLCAAALGAFSVNAMEMELPMGISSARDVRKFKGRYCEGNRCNSYDTASLEAKFNKEVEGDPVAEQAMELFRKAHFWHLVDYCEDNLPKMNAANAQLFMEALVLLAPHLDIGNYTKKVVNIIGDPTSITESYFQNRALLYDMFFYGAVYVAGCGYSWHLSEICASIWSEIKMLTYEFHRSEYDQFKSVDVREIAYSGELTEDHLPATATRVWPNLPDAFTIHKWKHQFR